MNSGLSCPPTWNGVISGSSESFLQLCIYIFINDTFLPSFFFFYFTVHLCKRKRHLSPSVPHPNTFYLPWNQTSCNENNSKYEHFVKFIHLLKIKRKFIPKKSKRASVFTPLIISLCLLSYPNTNYCFLSLCDRKVGDAFLSRLMPSIIHAQHPQTICVFLFARICEFLWSTPALCTRYIFTDNTLVDKRERDLQSQHNMYCMSYHLWSPCNYKKKINKPTTRLEPLFFLLSKPFCSCLWFSTSWQDVKVDEPKSERSLLLRGVTKTVHSAAQNSYTTHRLFDNSLNGSQKNPWYSQYAHTMMHR